MKKILLGGILCFVVSTKSNGQSNVTGWFKEATKFQNIDTIKFLKYFKAGEIALQDNNVLPENMDDSTLFYYSSCLYLAGREGINIGVDAYKKAIPYLQYCANNGNFDCNFYLSKMYENGWGVVPDIEMRKKYLEKAVLGGSMQHIAKNNLGYYYWSIKDYKTALKFFNLSASMGDYGLAYTNIGWLYYNGDGVEKDYAKAFQFFKTGEMKNDENLYYALGLGHCYSFGYGTNIDFEKALSYYRISASKKNARATARIGYMYEFGQGVKIDIDSAFFYYTKAASLKDAWGSYMLANMLSSKGKYYNQKSAISYYKMAIENKTEPWAYKGLVDVYIDILNGNSFEFPISYYEKEVEKNIKDGFINSGNDGNLKEELALCYYEYAKVSGSELTYYNAFITLLENEKYDYDGDILNLLGYYQLNGLTIKKDKQKAIDYFRRSKAKGNKLALDNLKILGIE